MFSYTITPRVADTDALGHINNTVLPCWFEEARTPLFRILNPTMDFSKWNLILARMEVDYLRQIFFHSPVVVNTWISRMGNSSFDVTQELLQDGNVCARSKNVIVHFDFKTQKSLPIVGGMRDDLEKHLICS